MKVDPATAAIYREAAEAGLKVLDQSLAGQNFLTGTAPTIADIACFGVTHYLADGNFNIADWPAVKAWSDRMTALPGYKTPGDLLPMADIP